MMKKFTLTVALLGSVYFSNAQVGIGTPTPHTSTLLDVKNTNGSKKGVKIPSVALVNTKTYSLDGTLGTDSESILVYNTSISEIIVVEGQEDINVKPGFYYWKSINQTTGYWERIATQSDLDAIINNMKSLDDIINLLQTAYPSNNLTSNAENGNQLGGGIVYTPGQDGLPPTFQFVYYDEEADSYSKQDVTEQIKNFIRFNETKTLLVQSTDKKYQYYVSELYLFNATTGAHVDTPTQTQIDGWDGTPPPGVYLIDVKNSFVKNFDTILQEATTIVKVPGVPGEPGVPAVYYTVQEYIELLSQNNLADGVTKIVLDNNGQASFEKWNNTLNTWEAVLNNAFETIVKVNETVTTFKKNVDGISTELVANDQPLPDDPLIETVPGTIIYEYNREDGKFQKLELTEDVKSILDNNNSVINRIKEIANQGNNIKQTLTTTVAAGTATAQSVQLLKAPSKIVSIHVHYGNGITASVTDLVVTGRNISFAIGTGITYHVLHPTQDTDVTLVVEYTE